MSPKYKPVLYLLNKELKVPKELISDDSENNCPCLLAAESDFILRSGSSQAALNPQTLNTREEPQPDPQGSHHQSSNRC